MRRGRAATRPMMRSCAACWPTPSRAPCAWSPPTAGSWIASTRPVPRDSRRPRFARCWNPTDAGTRRRVAALMAPVTRYAHSAGASIAYQVVGEGPLDVLFLTGWITQVEQLWEAPANRRFLERLTRLGRPILFDHSGTGRRG